MKRDKIINEDVSVNFRIAKPLKAKLLSKASGKNMTLSKYLRDVLEEIHNDKIVLEESISRNKDILFSKEFFQFIFWIYKKKRDKIREESDDIDGYIKLIKRLGESLPVEIVQELDKVLFDLIRIKSAYGSDKEYYQFPDSYSDDIRLDYDKLEYFFIGHDFTKYIEMTIR
ncbi:hypothetical protein [Winogradskyella schleiferi]|uniref:hypothetical protein n=1 Tax=Winogradskyella schleiferi TaxID=2686078 RepID=UPI0015C07820|nr:hypothetical protein [Winogradskyella schleiferi]